MVYNSREREREGGREMAYNNIKARATIKQSRRVIAQSKKPYIYAGQWCAGAVLYKADIRERLIKPGATFPLYSREREREREGAHEQWVH